MANIWLFFKSLKKNLKFGLFYYFFVFDAMFELILMLKHFSIKQKNSMKNQFTLLILAILK